MFIIVFHSFDTRKRNERQTRRSEKEEGGARRSLHVNRDCPKRSSARLREESRVCSGQVARVERGGQSLQLEQQHDFHFEQHNRKGQTFSLDMHLDGVSGIRISVLETCPRCSQGSQKQSL